MVCLSTTTTTVGAACDAANSSTAASATFGDGADPLALPAADFARSLAVNTTSAFVAAQEAVRAFRQLPESAARTFIYTGNILNTVTMGPLLDLGVGKSATAHVIESASIAYRDRGFKYVVPFSARGTGAGFSG
jgi:NAD(P)-dependent dehydrogenase (short-subunit alcohol dehydrogenase family)